MGWVEAAAMPSFYLRVSVLIGLAAAVTPVAAQDLTDDELRARFRTQMEALDAVRADPSLGASRGLVLSNVSPAEETEAGATVDSDVLTLSDPDAPTAGGEMTYVSFPEDQQVNVRVTFAFDSAALEESQKPKLRQVCDVLSGMDVGHLRIVGHTDAAGPASYNQQLSILRAEEVERFFVNDCGIEASRLEAVGVGEQFPYDSDDPLAGENRRVEFQAMS
jgi:OmpA-OmpF porin, OOP family